MCVCVCVYYRWANEQALEDQIGGQTQAEMMLWSHSHHHHHHDSGELFMLQSELYNFTLYFSNLFSLWMQSDSLSFPPALTITVRDFLTSRHLVMCRDRRSGSVLSEPLPVSLL